MIIKNKDKSSLIWMKNIQRNWYEFISRDNSQLVFIHCLQMCEVEKNFLIFTMYDIQLTFLHKLWNKKQLSVIWSMTYFYSWCSPICVCFCCYELSRFNIPYAKYSQYSYIVSTTIIQLYFSILQENIKTENTEYQYQYL